MDRDRDPKKRVQFLLTLPENSRCADCLAKDPKWASSKLGVFLCINCSGRHRDLGTHISFVRSCTLDSWTEAQALMMEQVGNVKANQYWEFSLPSDYSRPSSNDLTALGKFIKMKYEYRKWVDPKGVPPGSQEKITTSESEPSHISRNLQAPPPVPQQKNVYQQKYVMPQSSALPKPPEKSFVSPKPVQVQYDPFKLMQSQSHSTGNVANLLPDLEYTIPVPKRDSSTSDILSELDGPISVSKPPKQQPGSILTSQNIGNVDEKGQKLTVFSKAKSLDILSDLDEPALVKKNLNKVPNQESNTSEAKSIEKKPPPVKTHSIDILSELEMPAPVKKNLNKVPNQEPNTTGAKTIEKKPPPVKTDSLDILSELDGPVIVQSVSQPHVSAAPSNQNVNAFGSSNASGTVSQENSKSNDFFAELNGAYNVQLPNKQGSSPPPTFQPQLFDIIPSQPKQPSQAPINLKYGFNNRPGTPNAQARGGTGYFGQNVRDVFK